MGSARFALTIDKRTWARMDRVLAKASIELRQRMVKKAIRKAARKIAIAMKKRAPVSDDDKGKPLKETIGVVVREYGARTTAIIGPEYPAGSHGHLVEFGHEEVLFGVKTGRRVPPHPFARPAFDETKEEAKNEIVRSLVADVRTIGK